MQIDLNFNNLKLLLDIKRYMASDISITYFFPMIIKH